MKIFVGNLSTEASEDDLKAAAEAFGTVAEVSVAVDDKGASKGFGFVVMSTKEENQAALAGLNGKEIKGQTVKASEARPEKQRGGRGGQQSGFAGKGGQASRGPGKAAGGAKSGFQIGKSSGHKV